MSKKVPTAPCEACGGLLPLKPIHPRRSQRPSESKSGEDAHHPLVEEGSTNECESSGGGLPISDASETEESSSKLRSYDSVLEEIQAIFANQKVKRETISPYLHRARKHRDRSSSRLRRHERSQAHQHAIGQRDHNRSSKSRSPVNSPCFLHGDQGRHSSTEPTCKSSMAGPSDEPASAACRRDETTCKRIVGQLPPSDASNCSFDPLRISPSPRMHAAQASTHHLGEHSARGTAKAEGSSPRRKSCHGAVVHHQDPACRPACESPADLYWQPRMDNDCYYDVLQLYEECHIHQINQHIPAALMSSPRGNARRSRRQGCEEASLQPQQQIMSCCREHTVVLHDEECHLHPRDDPKSPAAPSPTTRNSTKCQRCGCSDQDYNTTTEPVPILKPTGRGVREAHVNSGSSPEQDVTACAQRISPMCKMHGDCITVAVSGNYCHPKRDHKAPQRKDNDLSPRKESTEGCHLHGFSSRKCQEPKGVANPTCMDAASPKFKDPLVGTPRRVRKPKPKLGSSAHWLDRIVAAQKFPSHVIQQFVQGKRKCPPRVKKPKCPACIAKSSKAQSQRTQLTFNRDLCEREVSQTGSDIASGLECKELKRGTLTRLALSRTLIIKPVVKLSTSRGPWSTRKEFEVCSECRNPLVSKSRRWKSMLEEISDVPKKCNMRFSCETIHGLDFPRDSGTGAIDLRCPELYSAFRLHSRLQKVQNETFDRHAAMQAAQSQGIEIDEEIFNQFLPEIKKPKKESTNRLSKGSPRSYVCRNLRREVYRDLCKIVDPPLHVYPGPEPSLRDVGVQFGSTVRSLEGSNKWKPSDFGAEPRSHVKQAEQSSLQLCNPNTTPQRPELEQMNCQSPEKSWDEQHRACLVEACKQARMEQGGYGSCTACPRAFSILSG